MKRLHLFAGAALAAWLAIAPVGSASAQQAGNRAATARVPSGVTPSGGSTTNYIGGAGGIPSRTFGRITSDNVARPNGTMQDNRGSAAQFRGQFSDLTPTRSTTNKNTIAATAAARADAALRNANNIGANANADANARRPNFQRNESNDAYFSNREALNDNDRFQSDPYQSATSSDDAARQREERLDQRRSDFSDRRRYYRDRYDERYGDRPTVVTQPVPAWGWGGADGFYVSGEYAGPVNDVPVDLYASGYTGPGGAQQLPRHNIWTPRHIQRNWAQHQWGGSQQHQRSMADDNGIPPRDRSSRSMSPARTQSVDRAANHVNANRGRDVESLNDEIPPSEAIDTARRVDARVDPRGR